MMGLRALGQKRGAHDILEDRRGNGAAIIERMGFIQHDHHGIAGLSAGAKPTKDDMNAVWE